jgi:hypothetical protein
MLLIRHEERANMGLLRSAVGRQTVAGMRMRPARVRRGVGSVSLFLGLGFGVPCVVGIRHFAQTGQVWTFMGFPTYGEGPFERIGVQTTTPLLVAFLAVCIAEVALAALVWTGAPYAVTLSYGLLPFELTFWIGFALPLGPPLGVARVALLLAVTGSASEPSTPAAAGDATRRAADVAEREGA